MVEKRYLLENRIVFKNYIILYYMSGITLFLVRIIFYITFGKQQPDMGQRV